MRKTKAHIVLILTDFLGLFLLWCGYHDIQQIILDVAHSEQSISFLNRIGFFIVGFGMLLIHGYVICEHLWSDFLIKKTKIINTSTLIFGIVLFAGAIFISIFMQHYVKKAGYQYCRGASGVSAMAKELVYTIDEETCRQLTAERREMLGLPPK